jgi:hypothetical protein
MEPELLEWRARQLAFEFLTLAMLRALGNSDVFADIVEKVFEWAADGAVVSADANRGKPETARALEIIDEFRKEWVR